VDVKTNVTPVIIRATGTISKSLREYLSNMPGEHEIKEIQKTAVLGTAHVLRRVLKKHRTYFTGEMTLHVARLLWEISLHISYTVTTI